MKLSTRRAVVFIAYTLITGVRPLVINDLKAMEEAPFGGEFKPPKFSIYDYCQRCYISVNIEQLHDIQLYNSGDDSQVSFGIVGANIVGRDRTSGYYFHGEVQSGRVTLYDDQHATRYIYAVR